MGPSRAHVRDQIDLYLTGALAPDEEQRVEEHLLLCPTCRTEADEFSVAAIAVAGLPAWVVNDIERASRATSAGTPAAPTVHGPQAAGSAGLHPTARPHRPLGRRVLAYAGVLLLGVVLGIGGTALVNQHPDSRVPAAQVAAAGTAGQFTVTATTGTGGTDIRAVVVGLRPGKPFDLLTIGVNGHAYLTAHGTADGGPQTLVGTVPIAPDQIRFFAVIQTAGDVLMVTATS